MKAILLALLLALLLVACDDDPNYPQGTYPCESAIAPCHTPTPEK